MRLGNMHISSNFFLKTLKLNQLHNFKPKNTLHKHSFKNKIYARALL